MSGCGIRCRWGSEGGRDKTGDGRRHQIMTDNGRRAEAHLFHTPLHLEPTPGPVLACLAVCGLPASCAPQQRSVVRR
jgi:hypothetical protein